MDAGRSMLLAIEQLQKEVSGQYREIAREMQEIHRRISGLEVKMAEEYMRKADYEGNRNHRWTELGVVATLAAIMTTILGWAVGLAAN